MTAISVQSEEAPVSEPVYTLPASWYHDPAIYEKERQRIFASEWLLFGHDALWPEPGSYVARTIAGWPVVVTRAQDGALKAFHNVCRHRASTILPEGTGKASALRCMYHGWTYDMDGQLKKVPDFGGDEAALCSRTKLFPIHLEIWNNLVFICLADTPPSFDEALGGLPEAARETDLGTYHFHSAATHTIRCNWKTYAENYAEGYHIPYAHPALNREVNIKSYRVLAGNRIARHVSTPRSGREGDAVNDGLWVWLWPHAALNVYRNGMNLELMVPTGPEEMELHYYYLFRDPVDEDGPRKTIAMSQVTTDEDIRICEAVQKNLRAGMYKRGELSPRHETGVAYFQQLVRDALA